MPPRKCVWNPARQANVNSLSKSTPPYRQSRPQGTYVLTAHSAVWLTWQQLFTFACREPYIFHRAFAHPFTGFFPIVVCLKPGKLGQLGSASHRVIWLNEMETFIAQFIGLEDRL